PREPTSSASTASPPPRRWPWWTGAASAPPCSRRFPTGGRRIIRSRPRRSPRESGSWSTPARGSWAAAAAPGRTTSGRRPPWWGGGDDRPGGKLEPHEDRRDAQGVREVLQGRQGV